MVLKCYIVFLTLISSFKLCICQRRISQGRNTPNGRNYMVYLLPSRYSKDPPDSWLCGGAIITETRVLTAAACLLDVDHTYVIAGYKKYVRALDVEVDECTRLKKQKVVKIILPKAYNISNWMKLDIGVAVVEKPYNFLDASYKIVCSYPPGRIKINYDLKYEETNKVAIVFGWGGDKVRRPGQDIDVNSKYLKEARTLVKPASVCQNKIEGKMEIYYLCAFGVGFMTSDGEDVNSVNYNVDGINLRRRMSSNDQNYPSCLEVNGTRKCNQSNQELNEMFNQYNSTNKTEYFANDTHTRRQDFAQGEGAGVCQNDHGVPLVSWIGHSEFVIGVALTSVLSAKYECNGPFLYTSTAQNGVLVDCLLALVSESKENKCQIVERTVEWPDSRSQWREIIKRRQQPLSKDQLLDKKPQYSVKLRPQAQLSNTQISSSKEIDLETLIV